MWHLQVPLRSPLWSHPVPPAPHGCWTGTDHPPICRWETGSKPLAPGDTATGTAPGTTLGPAWPASPASPTGHSLGTALCLLARPETKPHPKSNKGVRKAAPVNHCSEIKQCCARQCRGRVGPEVGAWRGGRGPGSGTGRGWGAVLQLAICNVVSSTMLQCPRH